MTTREIQEGSHTSGPLPKELPQKKTPFPPDIIARICTDSNTEEPIALTERQIQALRNVPEQQTLLERWNNIVEDFQKKHLLPQLKIFLQKLADTFHIPFLLDTLRTERAPNEIELQNLKGNNAAFLEKVCDYLAKHKTQLSQFFENMDPKNLSENDASLMNEFLALYKKL